MKYFLDKKIYLLILFLIFLLVYSLPIIVNLLDNHSLKENLTFFTGANLNGGTKLIQFLPILNEIVLEKNFFQNSVDQSLQVVNFENIRIVPFLIAALPGFFFNNLTNVIAFNYFLAYTLNISILYLIVNTFIKRKFLSLFLSINCFLISGFLQINPIISIKNILMLETKVFLDYSHISHNLEIIFQSLSNFILLLFLYIFIKYREIQNLKRLGALTLVFIFLGFSYQIHFIIGFCMIVINYIISFDFRKIKFSNYNLIFLLSLCLFIFISYFQVFLINSGSWSSADYSEINDLNIFIKNFLSVLSTFKVENILYFLLNTFFLVPIFLLIILNKSEVKEHLISIFIISIIFSFFVFATDFMNALNKRVLIRGIDVLLSVSIVIVFGLWYKKIEKFNFIKFLTIIFFTYIVLVPSVKIIIMAKNSYDNKNLFIPKDRMEVYKYLNENTPHNSLVVSSDPYDWELIPALTHSDMYYSNIFNTYRKPKEELSRYFDYLKFLNISFDDFKNNFLDIVDIKNEYNQNIKKIESRESKNRYILNDKKYEVFLFSRNILGFAISNSLIFNSFNGKKIEYSNTSFKNVLLPEMQKVYYQSNPNNIMKLDFIIVNKKNKIDKIFHNSLDEVFQNKNKLIYKIKKK